MIISLIFSVGTDGLNLDVNIVGLSDSQAHIYYDDYNVETCDLGTSVKLPFIYTRDRNAGETVTYIEWYYSGR